MNTEHFFKNGEDDAMKTQIQTRIGLALALILALLAGLAPRAEAVGVQKSVFSFQYSVPIHMPGVADLIVDRVGSPETLFSTDLSGAYLSQRLGTASPSTGPLCPQMEGEPVASRPRADLNTED